MPRNAWACLRAMPLCTWGGFHGRRPSAGPAAGSEENAGPRKNEGGDSCGGAEEEARQDAREQRAYEGYDTV